MLPQLYLKGHMLHVDTQWWIKRAPDSVNGGIVTYAGNIEETCAIEGPQEIRKTRHNVTNRRLMTSTRGTAHERDLKGKLLLPLEA